MAIIHDVPGLRVEIKVDGEPLEEYLYEDEEDTENTITRYVEANSGARFTVRWTYSQTFQYKDYDISAYLYVDGKYVDGGVSESSKLKSRDSRTVEISRVRSYEKGKFLRRDLLFSRIDIDENGKPISSERLKKSLRSLGEIGIRFFRGTLLGKRHPRSHEPFDTIDTVSEKALKGRAVSHQVKLGEAQPEREFQATSFQEKDKSPFATFKFRYRSRNALKAECVIPRSPTPTPLEDRPIEELTAEEARELVRRLKERDVERTAKQEVKQEVKQERRPSTANVIDLGSDDSDLEVTNVRSRKRQRTSGPVEVIDLCDD